MYRHENERPLGHQDGVGDSRIHMIPDACLGDPKCTKDPNAIEDWYRFIGITFKCCPLSGNYSTVLQYKMISSPHFIPLLFEYIPQRLLY